MTALELHREHASGKVLAGLRAAADSAKDGPSNTDQLPADGGEPFGAAG